MTGTKVIGVALVWVFATFIILGTAELTPPVPDDPTVALTVLFTLIAAGVVSIFIITRDN